jgi:hypothetical protein
MSSTMRDVMQGQFAETSKALRHGSPLFSEIARHCIADNDLLDLACAAPEGQASPLFLMLTTQYVLMRSPASELARHFAAPAEMAGAVGELFTLFRGFCLSHGEEIAGLMRSRTLCTNLVERASYVVPALAHAQSFELEPGVFIEVGCSAGLNLLFDQYHLTYGSAGPIGCADSPVVLECAVLGDPGASRFHSLTASMPLVTRRIGVDLIALNPCDQADALWLEAMLLPEWVQQRRRLRVALELRKRFSLELIVDDAIAALPALLEQISGPVYILASFLLQQLNSSQHCRFDEILRDYSHGRTLHRIDVAQRAAEHDGGHHVGQRLRALSRARLSIARPNVPSILSHVMYRDGVSSRRELAEVDGLGRWIWWSGE